jgi:tetratricopeptide (TPR) repeat protein
VQVIETSLRALSKEHPSTLTSMANLALTYRSQGRWKEAEELFVQVIETSLRVLGEEHPDTLTSIANLALTYRNQGRWKEAEELDGDEKEGARRGASFHTNQHEQPCLHIEGTWPKCGSYQTNGEMCTVADAGLRC